MNNFPRFYPIYFLRIFPIIVSVFWLGALSIRAADYYVRPSPCTNTDLQSPYTSWNTAATNIQWAVNVAMTNLPATVWVSNGTYCLTNQVEITNNITVRGVNGWTNTFVYAGWPVWTTRCFYVANTGVVDGFTISNGHYMISNNYNGGGGAYITNATIQNCYFITNVCSNSGNYGGGGGIFVTGSGNVFSCTLVGNVSCAAGRSDIYQTFGGAINLYGARNSRIYNCSLVSNYSTGTGGGMGVNYYNSSGTIISNCVFSNNISIWEGSAIAGQQFTLINCVIRKNSGDGVIFGPYLIIRDCLIADNSNTLNSSYSYAAVTVGESSLMSNCIVSGNGNGGGAAMARNAIIDHCIFSNNFCNASGIYVFWEPVVNNVYSPPGGGVTISRQGGIIRNSLICNNSNIYSAGSGGGLYVTNSATNRAVSGVINCTIANNYSTNEGGGVCAVNDSNYFVNCIVAGNRSSSNNYPDVFNRDAINSNNYYYCCANVTSAPLVANQGNITNDPRFADSSAGNWRLANNSPCINTGSNMSWMTNLFDLDGRARIRYGTVDMGAYEKINEATIYNFR